MSVYRWIRLFLTFAFLAALVPVTGEFFIRLAEEHGMYEKPSARLGAAVSTLFAVANLPYFKIVVAVIGGLVAGMWIDSLVRRRSKAPVTGIPAKIETSIRLQFNYGHGTPHCIDEKNIWRWYALAQMVTGIDPKQGNIVRQHVFWILFLTFNEPVFFKEIRIDGGGAKLPIYEVKDSGPRHAVIYVSGSLEGVVLEIRTVN